MLKKLSIVIMLILLSLCNAQPLSLTHDGFLLIDDSKKWTSKDFVNHGYKLKKEKILETIDGPLPSNVNYYDLDVMQGEKTILYFEIKEKYVSKGVLLDNSVPLKINKDQIKVGDTLQKLVSLFGKYVISYDEHIKMHAFFDFYGYDHLSFETECDEFSYELYSDYANKIREYGLKPISLKEYALQQDGLNKCTIKRIHFMIDQKRIWQ